MKGIIFTEFLEMVEHQHGMEMVDQLILHSDLPSGGIYTSVGTYQHKEMYALINQLSIQTKVPINELLRTFGKYLFHTFSKSYHQIIDQYKNSFQLLAAIESHIHVEVKKLYPEAELPHFEMLERSNERLVMDYHSSRKMADLGIGLIEGCMEYFSEMGDIQMTLINEDKSLVRFTIKLSQCLDE